MLNPMTPDRKPSAGFHSAVHATSLTPASRAPGSSRKTLDRISAVTATQEMRVTYGLIEGLHFSGLDQSSLWGDRFDEGEEIDRFSSNSERKSESDRLQSLQASLISEEFLSPIKPEFGMTEPAEPRAVTQPDHVSVSIMDESRVSSKAVQPQEYAFACWMISQYYDVMAKYILPNGKLFKTHFEELAENKGLDRLRETLLAENISYADLVLALVDLAEQHRLYRERDLPKPSTPERNELNVQREGDVLRLFTCLWAYQYSNVVWADGIDIDTLHSVHGILDKYPTISLTFPQVPGDSAPRSVFVWDALLSYLESASSPSYADPDQETLVADDHVDGDDREAVLPSHLGSSSAQSPAPVTEQGVLVEDVRASGEAASVVSVESHADQQDSFASQCASFPWLKCVGGSLVIAGSGVFGLYMAGAFGV